MLAASCWPDWTYVGIFIQVLFGAFFSSGQVCMSNERVIVHESIADEFESVLRNTARVLLDRGVFELGRPGAAEDTRARVDEALSQASTSGSALKSGSDQTSRALE